MHKICGIFIYRKCKKTEKSYIFRYDDIWMHPPSPSNPTHTLFLRHEVHIRSSQIDINVNNPKYLHNPDNQRSSLNFFLIHVLILCRCMANYMLLKGDNSQIKHGKYPQRSGIHNTAGIEYLKDTKRILNF